MSRNSHLDKVPGFVTFHFSKDRKLKIILSMLLTRHGKTLLCLKLGQVGGVSSSAQSGRREQAAGTWIILSLRGLKFASRWGRQDCAMKHTWEVARGVSPSACEHEHALLEQKFQLVVRLKIGRTISWIEQRAARNAENECYR